MLGIAALGIEVCRGLLTYYDGWKAYDTDLDSAHDAAADLTKTLALLKACLDAGQRCVTEKYKSLAMSLNWTRKRRCAAFMAETIDKDQSFARPSLTSSRRLQRGQDWLKGHYGGGIAGNVWKRLLWIRNSLDRCVAYVYRFPT